MLRLSEIQLLFINNDSEKLKECSYRCRSCKVVSEIFFPIGFNFFPDSTSRMSKIFLSMEFLKEKIRHMRLGTVCFFLS